MSLSPRVAVTAGLALASVLVVVGASLAVTTPASDPTPDTAPRGPSGISAAVSTVPTGAAVSASTAAPVVLTAQHSRQAPIRLRITVGDVRVRGTLRRSPAARDLLRQLPLTLQMSEHGGVEKTGRLPRALSLRGQPASADPVVGDIGYYAPGRDLVLYHGDQSRYPGIVVLGRLAPGAAAQVAARTGTVTVRVRAVR